MNVKFITINELKIGMIIAKDIIVNNIVFVKEGVLLNDQIIDSLKQTYFYGRIAIYDDGDERKKSASQKETEDTGKILEEFSIDIENIFTEKMDSDKSTIDELREFSKRIQNEITSTGGVIRNIVLYGSGQDCIYRHSVNVAVLSAILGEWLGMDHKEVNLLTYSAIMHDFGKTKINQEYLNKKGILTRKEYEEVKKHPILGYNYMKSIPFLDSSVSLGVLMHHERLDGSGYPLGIKEDKITNFARIIAIADVFDAINSDRIYKKSAEPFAALETIQKESLGKLDYLYCKVFLEHVINYYMGEQVLLNTKKVCKIVQVNINNLSKPLLLDDSQFVDLNNEKDIYVERLLL